MATKRKGAGPNEGQRTGRSFSSEDSLSDSAYLSDDSYISEEHSHDQGFFLELWHWFKRFLEIENPRRKRHGRGLGRNISWVVLMYMVILTLTCKLDLIIV